MATLSEDGLTTRLSRILMDHAVQFLELADATVMIVVEGKDGSRLWAANGSLREEFRLKKVLKNDAAIEELTPVKVSTRSEIYAVDEKDAPVGNNDSTAATPEKRPVVKRIVDPSIPPPPVLPSNGNAVSADDDDDDLVEFSQDNLSCFSLKDLKELKTEREKLHAQLEPKKRGKRASPEIDKEIEKSLKIIRMVDAAIESKMKEGESNNDKTPEDVSTTPKKEAPATKRKLSSTSADAGGKKAKTPDDIDATLDDGAKCHRCGNVGHIALDCKAVKIEEDESTTSAISDEPKTSSSVAKGSVAVPDKPEKKNATPTSGKEKTPGHKTPMICHYCQQPGHKKPFCFKMKSDKAKGLVMKQNGGGGNGGMAGGGGNVMDAILGNLPGMHQNPGMGGPSGMDGPNPGMGGFNMGGPNLGMGGMNPGMNGSNNMGGPNLGMAGPNMGDSDLNMGGPNAGMGGPPFGPPPISGGKNTLNPQERAMVENQLETMRMSRGLRYSWSASEGAYLVMMQDQNMRNDTLIKITSVDQLYELC